MRAAWTAGSVRAQALLNRRLGVAGTGGLAGCTSFSEALARLAASPYGHDVRPDQTVDQAEHALAETVLWHLRVLAGWLPRSAAELMRACAAWFEIGNLLDHLRALHGADSRPPYQLGALATAWPRLAVAGSPGELRAALAASPWGDPGTDETGAVAVTMWAGWAARMAAASPHIRPWAAAGAALLAARERFLLQRPVPELAARRLAGLLGARQGDIGDFTGFAASLPSEARWVLRAAENPGELWRAEEGWWHRVDQDARELRRHPGPASQPVVACVALLAVDARRCRTALELAARGGGRWEEFDALV
ncbi:V-type ATPase subunit [Amycolatopsis taiwanensis]|uniref:V-type ATPase subunit n=1 Tax=Amycolatopsis taiwanensis TaxID=342230 RepID=A0A9W6VKF6_9PSEU|nr:V-type ATPase subunit [Amycolatopsis taiwanensis]GLY70554.1 hypothetical protein Atai01_71730 [Amycolatopsis taiwanensis]